MKIGIIGATGMVGHILFYELRRKNIDVIGIGRRKVEKEIVQFDLYFEWEQVKNFLQHQKFDVIINCSAILVNESVTNKLQAVYINSYLPHLLVELFKNSNTKIIHLSTGGVFSGNDEYYFEDSTLSPQTYYGVTKAAGEFNNNKDLVIRCDFWGPDNKKNGSGLFNWFLNQTGNITAYTNVFFNGISNVEFVKILLNMINFSGIIHIGTTAKYSKGFFLESVNKIFSLKKDMSFQNSAVNKSIFLKSRKLLSPVHDLDIMMNDVYQYLMANPQCYADIYPQIYKGQ